MRISTWKCRGSVVLMARYLGIFQVLTNSLDPCMKKIFFHGLTMRISTWKMLRIYALMSRSLGIFYVLSDSPGPSMKKNSLFFMDCLCSSVHGSAENLCTDGLILGIFLVLTDSPDPRRIFFSRTGCAHQDMEVPRIDGLDGSISRHFSCTDDQSRP